MYFKQYLTGLSEIRCTFDQQNSHGATNFTSNNHQNNAENIDFWAKSYVVVALSHELRFKRANNREPYSYSFAYWVYYRSPLLPTFSGQSLIKSTLSELGDMV